MRWIAAIVLLMMIGCASTSARGSDAPGTRTMSFEQEGSWIGNAVCYGPYREGQRPGGESPTDDQLREDLQIMAKHWSLLRIYGSQDYVPRLLRIIREDEIDMQVVLGVWLSPSADHDNDAEIAAAIELANDYRETVPAVCVGNETQVFWSGHKMPRDPVIEIIQKVRDAVSQPVTTADDFNYWNKPESRAMAAEIDFILLHAHPLWNGQQLDGGLAWLEEQIAAIAELHPDRAIVLGEIGWATSYLDEGLQGELIQGVAGEPEQAVFYEVIRAWSERERMPAFWFEAFDENWKGGMNPTEVEKHWGLYRADRSPKAAILAD